MLSESNRYTIIKVDGVAYYVWDKQDKKLVSIPYKSVLEAEEKIKDLLKKYEDK